MNTNKLRKDLESIISDITYFANKKGLFSLSIVGTLANPLHEFEEINDIDILYIYEDSMNDGKKSRISSEVYESIEELNRIIIDKYSRDYVIVSNYECGPFKPIPEAGVVKIELHNIIYTVNRWLKEEPSFLFDRARFHRLLYGKSPGDIYNVERLTKYTVIKDLFGIEHCIKMIKDKEIKYCIWEHIDDENLKVGVKSKELQLDSYESKCKFIELIFYSIIKSSVNSVRIFTNNVSVYKIECEKFSQYFASMEYVDFLDEILHIKKEFRNNNLDLKLLDFTDLADRSIKFLYNLKQSLVVK